MTKEEKIICKNFLNDADKTHSCNEYKLLMALLEQEPREITLEDVKEYCKPRCLTIITNELLYELTHPKIKELGQEPKSEWEQDHAILKAYSDGANEVIDKIRAEIGNHCGLTKGKHCRYCSYCHSVMGVREILEIIDKYKGEKEQTDA